jgi:hypothetical protein
MTKAALRGLAVVGLLAAAVAGCANERPPMPGSMDQPAAAPGQPPNAPIRQPGNRG